MRRLYEPKDRYTEVRQEGHRDRQGGQRIHGRGTSRDEGARPRAEGGSAPRPAREAGGRGTRRAREDCRDAETGSRHGRAAPCHHQRQRASPLAENLVRDARVRQGRQCRLLLPKRAQVQGEVRDLRLQRQGEPRRRHRVAGRLRAEGVDRRRRGKDRRAREESGELRRSLHLEAQGSAPPNTRLLLAEGNASGAALVSLFLWCAAPAAHQADATLRNFEPEVRMHIRPHALALMAALVTDDVFLFAPGAPDIKGRAAIQAAAQQMFRSLKITDFRVLNSELQVVGDTAYEVTSYSETLIPAGGTPSPVQGRYLIVWKRSGDGRWRVHRKL